MQSIDYDQHLGLKKGTVELWKHDPIWALIYTQQSDAILKVLVNQIESIHHIGSTAIAGIKAKPIIDILIGVASFDDLPIIVHHMQLLGFTYRGENGIADRHYFIKGQPRQFHVHLTLSGNDIYQHYLLFRDRLRANLDWAKAYETIKLNLAKALATDRKKYQAGKHDFIQSVLNDKSK